VPTPSLFEADRRHEKTPVVVLTGFLGSGKTTLLNRWLRSRGFGDTAVIVNELGDVALDHLLVERIEGEVALLKTGCVCCAVRSDFEQTLTELLARRDEGSLPPFARVVVETTGLADPAPLVQAVETAPRLSQFCTLGAVVATVDAVNAPAQFERQWEARKQVALADRLVLTKRDLLPGGPAAPEVPRALAAALDALNLHAVRADARALPADPRAWLAAPADRGVVAAAAGLLAAPRGIGPLHGEVGSFVLEASVPLDWPRLQAWLAWLRAEHGEQLLRLKGLVRVQGEAAPLLLHGVHHLFHPPVAVPQVAWAEGCSALVLIGRGLEPAALRPGFEACRVGAGEGADR
jgi:G3E family GTPase